MKKESRVDWPGKRTTVFVPKDDQDSFFSILRQNNSALDLFTADFLEGDVVDWIEVASNCFAVIGSKKSTSAKSLNELLDAVKALME